MIKLVEIAIFTDAHYSEKSEEKEEKWFPAKIKKMRKEKIEYYLNYWDTLTQRAFQKLLRRAKKQGSFDLIISLGDDTPGTNQMGLITEKAQQEQRKYKELIANAFPNAKIFSVWGDHDTGYNDIITALQGWKGGKMSIKSFEAAEKLIGDPWFSKEIERFTLLFLNSEIIRESKNPKNPEQDFFVKKAKEQEKFIQEHLDNTNNKVILFIHDPIQLKHLRKILKPYEKNIVLTLAGHFHSPTIWKLYDFLTGMVKTMRSFSIKVIPAIWGQVGLPQQIILGRGGYATLMLNNGQFSLKRYKL